MSIYQRPDKLERRIGDAAQAEPVEPIRHDADACGVEFERAMRERAERMTPAEREADQEFFAREWADVPDRLAAIMKKGCTP